MGIKISRQSITAGVLVASTIGLMVLVFGIFEDAVGHGIAIASLAATTTIVVFQSHSRAGRPMTIALSYTLAAGIGVVVSLLIAEFTLLQVAVGVTSLVILLAAFDRMHPPAVAYLFGFILGGYGAAHFFMTLLALLAFFVSLAVIVFILEEIVFFLGLSEKGARKPKPESILESIEWFVDRVVPFALVLLFASVLSQFLYYDYLEQHEMLFCLLSSLDWAIIVLLVIDLGFKFKKAKTGMKFLQEYWLEVIAVLPFFVVFRAFEGLAISLYFLTKGSVNIPVGSQALLRFLRPMARFPRFIRMLDNLDSLAGFSKK